MGFQIYECRIDNIILYGGEATQIKYLDHEKVGFYHHLQKEMIFRKYDSMDLAGMIIDKQLLEWIGFVPHADGKPMEHVTGDMYEFTDGRVILRTHSDGVSVFTPINMPWATPDFPLQAYYINQIYRLHELQNIYFDLFKIPLDIEAININNKQK
jgi:hypothetical protein